jgi:hypothetical protein
MTTGGSSSCPVSVLMVKIAVSEHLKRVPEGFLELVTTVISQRQVSDYHNSKLFKNVEKLQRTLKKY